MVCACGKASHAPSLIAPKPTVASSATRVDHMPPPKAIKRLNATRRGRRNKRKATFEFQACILPPIAGEQNAFLAAAQDGMQTPITKC